MQLHPNHLSILEAVRQLSLADLELLTAVCAKERENGKYHGFGPRGVRFACDRLLERGYLHRLWKHRNPKFRHDRGSARQVYLLSGRAADLMGLEKPEAVERRYQTLKDPRREYLLEHELQIAHFHGTLMALERRAPELCTLDEWEQGEGISVPYPNDDARKLRIMPDARFTLLSRALGLKWRFILEADTGQERINSDDPERRTIVGKLERYSKLMKFEGQKFLVLFLVPRRSSLESIMSRRERSIMEAVQSRAVLPEFRGNFRIMSESDVRCMEPLLLFEPVVWVPRNEPERVPLIPRP